MTADSAENAASLEEALTRDNPKGQLWELCAQRRIAPPTVRHAVSGVRHRAQMEFAIGEWELDSGVTWGSSRKLAEQAAARALLDELAALEAEEPSVRPKRREVDLGGDDVFDVDADDVERLRALNAKGRLHEWCQKQKPPAKRPQFESRPLGGGAGFAVRARLKVPELMSPWFRAARRKEAEQAAAEGLLHLLPEGEVSDAVTAERPVHPRTQLNELRQQGRLAECSVEITGSAGSAHAPTFTAEAAAMLVDGTELRAGPVEASTKRTALEQAAAELLNRIERTATG